LGGLIPAGEVDGHLRIGGGIDLFPSDARWWVEDTDRGCGDRELQASPLFVQWGTVSDLESNGQDPEPSAKAHHTVGVNDTQLTIAMTLIRQLTPTACPIQGTPSELRGRDLLVITLSDLVNRR
jgi:hypothetical protein